MLRRAFGTDLLRLAGLGGAFACLLCPAALAQSADFIAPRLELSEAGIFCPIPSAGTAPAPGTESGVINLIDGDHRVALHDHRVPAHIGLSFGIRIRLAPGAPPGPYSVVLTHPPVGPRAVTREVWNAEIGTDYGVRLFEFEFDRELRPGAWVFEITDGTTTYLRQSFEVVPPRQAPAAIDLCFGQQLLS
ncbi:DUF3859 domain-containing protein [Pseudooceanicola aestuarii]|uniref:DUF3859 domain-containing protein n=1 Tax=Pseudooceanicola aestuarii TaxID=2697319 RepID=UPI0013CFAC7F|nr:DUF3859 domain-containing protein [Pseudooceanicola aestuarii]